ncbi:MAG: acetyl-CoA carboxylase biotin carboxyl carrier protein [Ruminococcus sp.]|nr:acetyl-CoA carboxylase biotin carboxyl carrier protein [Ruminococcus sp.]
MSDNIYGQLDLETIEKLADIVNNKELSELTIVDGGKEITIKGRRNPPPMPPMPQMGMQPQGMQPPAPPAVPAQAPVQQAEGKLVKAPIVGTFYAAPAPDSEPFVSVGDKVKKGDTIFIIESMKVMSEVQSEFDGVVTKILVNNGEPVEFDQTLMVLE